MPLIGEVTICASEPRFSPRRSPWRRSARRPPTSSSGGTKGYYPEEDEAVREIIAAFEQETGKQVELAFYPESELPDKIEAALEAGQPPDFAFGSLARQLCSDMGLRRSARGSHRTPIGHFSRPVRSGRSSTRHDCSTRGPARTPCTGCRWAYRPTMSTSGRACWSRRASPLDDIPKEWERVLVVLVRPGAAGGAQGAGPRRHLGRRLGHVGRGRRHARPNSTSS